MILRNKLKSRCVLTIMYVYFTVYIQVFDGSVIKKKITS